MFGWLLFWRKISRQGEERNSRERFSLCQGLNQSQISPPPPLTYCKTTFSRWKENLWEERKHKVAWLICVVPTQPHTRVLYFIEPSTCQRKVLLQGKRQWRRRTFHPWGFISVQMLLKPKGRNVRLHYSLFPCTNSHIKSRGVLLLIFWFD